MTPLTPLTPRLSVVVPVHNVEEHLGACLESLARQSLKDLDVVLVDDGSTDGSAGVAREFAARDGRFRVVGRENGGLGAARNTGVAHAVPGTEYLAFVDSDDVLPSRAFELLTGALDKSGSDFASGNVLRLTGGGRLQQHPLFTRPMRSTRPATHVTKDWSLLLDRIACNKVFRRTFWDEHSFAFPEGVLYEDIPVVLPAHFAARSVDVLQDAVYYWRFRDSSITNRRAVVRGVADRTAAVLGVSRGLAGTPEHKKRYDESVLREDLWYFMRVLPEGDAAYREAFLERTGEFTAQVDPEVLAGLPLHHRVKWHLARERRLEELLGLLEFERRSPRTHRVRGLRRRTAEYPPLTAPLPREVLALAPGDLPLEARLTGAEWRDGVLRLTGYGYIRNLPARARRHALKAAWLRTPDRRALPLRLKRVNDPSITARSGQQLHGYDWAGFEIAVDPARLLTESATTTWKLVLGVLGHGVARRGGVGDGGAQLEVHYLDEHTRIVPVFAGGRLQLNAERVQTWLTGHDSRDGVLTLTGETRTRASALRLGHWHSEAAIQVPLARDGERFTAEVPLDELAAVRGRGPVRAPHGESRPADAYSVQLVEPDGKRLPVAAPPGLPLGRHAVPGGRELAFTVSAWGNAVLTDQLPHAYTESVTWTDNSLVLQGLYGGGPAVPLQLRRTGAEEEEVELPVRCADGRFRVESAYEALTLIGEGEWQLSLGEAPVRIPAAAHPVLPAPRAIAGRDVGVRRQSHDHLVLVVSKGAFSCGS
ncbi:glycosyltransferase [Streptomyces sp. BPTC-684]|uniref:glycosyltransferase family 2 protein n=1 Tax=Streptomyces sp. BPTC-684 TaxID=3043734 RepID=UPI0024B08D3F|nr:glycosyltransferase [Streptomyces sp. BPTC-684]WHM38474.1 glycosyltransferase [Streptomyces sp. BPTC-684]